MSSNATIRSKWEEFAKILPDNLTHAQRVQLKQAFYVGSSAALLIVRVAARQTSVEDSKAIINAATKEVTDFMIRFLEPIEG